MKRPTILVADDLTALSTKARRRAHRLRNFAANLAKAMNYEVDLFYAEDIPETLRKRSRVEPLEKRNPEVIRKVRKELERIAPAVDVHSAQGTPVNLIFRWAAKKKAEMIVIGTRGTKGIGKFLLGSIAEEISRTSPYPVIVLGPQTVQVGFGRHGKKPRILLVTDLSYSSRAAETFAKKIALKTKAQLTVLHSIGDIIRRIKISAYHGRIPLLSLDQQFRDLKKSAKDSLQQKKDNLKKDLPLTQARLLTEEVELPTAVIGELKNGYDLIVMGTHARGRIATAFLGSSTRTLCLTSPVPVAIVGPSQPAISPLRP